MGKLLRYSLSISAAAILAAVFAVLLEPAFAEALRIFGINPAKWAQPTMAWLTELVAQEWFRFVSAGVVGAAIGAWLHWGAARYDRRNTKSVPDSQGAPEKKEDKLKSIGRRCRNLMLMIDDRLNYLRIGDEIPYSAIWAAYLPIQIDLEKFGIKSPDGPLESEGDVRVIRELMMYMSPLLLQGHLKEAKELGRNSVYPPKDPHAGIVKRLRAALAQKIDP